MAKDKKQHSRVATKLTAFTLAEGATHVDSLPTKRFAFTLAEVLITLGIIGVVAAMTIPALMTHYEKYITGIRVKKAYAELLQAIKLSEADNGDFEGWELKSDASIETTRENMKNFILPYMTGIQECDTGLTTKKCGATVSYAGVNYLLNNGVVLAMRMEKGTPNHLYVTMAPQVVKSNRVVLGKNTFFFNTINDEKKLYPAGWKKNLTREEVKNGYYTTDGDYFQCKKSNDDNNIHYRHGCTALLMLDNWKINNDYPW